MEERRRTWFDDRGLVLGAAEPSGERRVPFYGAAMHYWRTPRALWRTALDGLAALGIRVVESYVPWGVHEKADGSGFDWSGNRDLGAWLDEVQAAGLVAALRPGPHINAELTFFGFPERIVRDPDIQARGAHGGPVWLPAPPRAFPVPSYASARLHDEVAAWFEAVGEIASPRRFPDGPVVALQVDNEPQMFFRLGAFDHDYHPDAIAAWKAGPGEGEDPPRRWAQEDEGTCAHWVRWKDEQLADALGRFNTGLDDAGLRGIARFGNLPPGEPWFTDLPRLERAIGGPVGIDVYAGAGDLGMVRRRALHLTGSTSHLPIVPELGAGFVPYAPPFSDDDQRAVTLALLGGGVRGFSFYMGVTRDRWMGGLLDEEARPRPPARTVEKLLRALVEIDWTALRRRTRVALVLSRADARHGLASSLIDPLPPIAGELMQLGPGGSAELARDPAAALHRRWFDAAARALELAQVPYDIVDEGAPLERLLAHDAIVAPTLHRVDRALWKKLGEAAAAKRVVVIGPETPSLDEWGEPLVDDAAVPRRAGFMAPGSVDDIAGLAEDLAALEPQDEWYVERPAGITASTFVDGGGHVRALFVQHAGDKDATARIVVPPDTTVRDALSDDVLHATDGAVAIPLRARDVRFFVVQKK
ncbi:MAG TPA: alpha-amylase family protein [Kofleriaceae bacterium]|nr:alpha-amylase family protein [Kofleriaceae bacterium]